MAARLIRARGAFFRKFVAAFLAGAVFFSFPCELRARTFQTVVIDAGHGGFDRGGVPGQRVGEKGMTLDVAQRLATRLRSSGYKVVMTRNTDVFVTLGERARIANSYSNAIFVCIHFNSASRVGANGVETYYYSNQSAQLAANIHRHLVGSTTTENRGIRRRGYYVLRRAKVPAVLVECGFLTNPYESRLVSQSSYRQTLADRIADGVMGKATPPNRPVVSGLTHVPSPIQDRSNYNDFVRAEGERQSSRRSSKSSKKKKSSRSSKKSSKKKSSSSTSKKKKSSTSSKEKETSDADQ
jgi:N-acetylmuramoyl-L-alanine amidase